jgi:hypothetical protein
MNIRFAMVEGNITEIEIELILIIATWFKKLWE